MFNMTYEDTNVVRDALIKAKKFGISYADEVLGVFMTAAQQSSPSFMPLSLDDQMRVQGVLEAGTTFGVEGVPEAKRLFEEARKIQVDNL